MPTRNVKYELTIANGATASGTLTAAQLRAAKGLLIIAPAFGAVTVEVQTRADDTGTFVELQSAGADVALIASKATPVAIDTPLGGLRLLASAAVAGDQVFDVLVMVD